MQKVYEFLNNFNFDNEYIVVATSGGPDSMFLLNLLIKLREKLNLKIVVAHVHHNHRKESDEEATKLQDFCNKNNLIFEMKKINEYPNNKFSEEFARNFRYNFFGDILKKYNTDILFTAHHADDLIETILMRITRGSSVKGYTGFSKISMDRGYKIVRPLIYITKSEIEEYMNNNNMWYAVDVSNESDVHTRNRFRKNILPKLKEENSNVHEKFIEFSEKILLVDEYVKKESLKIYNIIVKDNIIDVNSFNELDEIIKIYILEEYIKKIYKNNIVEISYKHIRLIIDMLLTKEDSKIDLPNNMKGILEYNKFKIINYIKNIEYDYTFYDKIVLPNGRKIEIDNDTLLTSNYVIHLNSKDIKMPFHVRTRRNGDKMSVKNMSGVKKVNDIFTNCKISKELRDIYPIVTDDDDNIIWIPGIKKSNFDRKKDKKYDIILKYI